ncbi:MAG: thiol reductant ABC exporter subunit CydD [Chloroflexota bacterium]
MMDRRLFTEAKAARLALILTVVMGLLTGVTVIIQAFFLSRVINLVFLEGESLSGVGDWLLLLAGAIILRTLLTWVGTTAARHIAIQVKTELRTRLMAHLFALGPTFARGERSGELVNTATEGVEALDSYFSEYLPGLFNALLVPLLILFVVFPIDLLTFLVLFITAPLIPIFMALIGIVAGRMARRQYGAMSRMSAHFLDVMQGLTTLKLFNRSQRQTQTIQKVTDDFRTTTMGVLRVAFLSAFWLELMATISVAVVAVQIGLRLLYGGIDFEPALFLLVVAPDYYLPLRQLGAQFHSGTEGAAAAKRIFAVLQATAPQAGLNPSAAVPAPPYDVRFEDVRFAYGEDRPALKGVSLTLTRGQRVALVGPSGGGKSTLAALLLRFIEPDDGVLYAGDVPLHTIDAPAWREQVAWVPQAPYLFNTTIMDNIRIGRDGASDDAVRAAAQQAGAHEFIMALPQGYATIVGEQGARLSGGQAQRVAIARAFLRDAPLLVLDEATSSLDPESEAVIEASLARLMQGRTTLIIAHRLNTVFTADHIVVLDAGQVVQQGTHAALIAQPGLYRNLVTAYDAATSAASPSTREA